MPELTLRDVMTREYVGVSESDTVIGAVRVMREDDAQTAVVLRGREPVGVLSAADVLDLLLSADDVASQTVEQIMKRGPPSLDPEDALGDAAAAMNASGTEQVLVTENDDLIGVVTMRDVALYSWEMTDTVQVDEEEFVGTEPTERETVAEESYSDQSICEACGSLSRDLVNVNGQLLCPDCRTV
ncbi:MAG: CBS domain-containing protein [Halanaeroarchaeum sp.]